MTHYVLELEKLENDTPLKAEGRERFNSLKAHYIKRVLLGKKSVPKEL